MLEVDGSQDLEGTQEARSHVRLSQALRAPGHQPEDRAHRGCPGGRGSKGVAEQARQSLSAEGKRSARARVFPGEGGFPGASGVKNLIKYEMFLPL